MSPGNLFFVTGYFGSGKSTLVKAVLEEIPSLMYLKTFTTRLPRNDESESFEYTFVSRDEYEYLRDSNKVQDHTLVGDNYYGTDASLCNNLLAAGENVICCVIPSAEAIEEMASWYDIEPIVIWIDTPLYLANERLLNLEDKSRTARVDNPLQSQENADKVMKMLDAHNN